MDIYTLQEITRLAKSGTAGSTFGMEPYGKYSPVIHYGMMGHESVTTSSSFNNATYRGWFMSELLGGCTNGSSTLGSQTAVSNNYAGHKANRPSQMYFANEDTTRRSAVVISEMEGWPSTGQYNTKPVMMIAVRNTSASDITVPMYVSGGAYSTHSPTWTFTLVPDNADNSQVTAVTYTELDVNTTSNLTNTRQVSYTLPAGKTTIIGVGGGQYYYSQEYMASRGNCVGFEDIHVLATNSNLEPDNTVASNILMRTGYWTNSPASWQVAIDALAGLWTEGSGNRNFQTVGETA
jgi:hypothetical protein